MTVRFGGDTSGLQGAVGQAKGILGTLTSNPLAAVGVGLAAVGAAAVGFGIASVKAAGDFQTSMSKVQAYAGLTKGQTDDLGNSILSLATAMGQSPKAMADALYPIISSGYSAAQALNILKLSAMTSAASGADMSVVADALTTSLKAMHAPASQAGQYMDYINKIVSLGKGTVPQYAAVIGKLALAAGSAHVPFSDMGAALATLTTHGFPSVAQASTSLGNLFTQIGPKVDAVAQHAKKLGLSFNENSFKTMDLSHKLAYLKEITGGNQGELLKLVGGSTVALKAFNALTGSSKDFTSNLDAMKGATGTTAQVFKTTYNDWNNSVARLGATFQVLLIKVGQQLLPVLTGLVQNVTPIIGQFATWITTSGIIPKIIGFITLAITGLIIGVKIAIGVIQGIIGVISAVVGWFIQWHVPLMIVGGAILTFLAPALIGLGIQAAATGVMFLVNLIPALIAFAAQAVIAAATAIPAILVGFISWAAGAWAVAAANIAAFWPVYLIIAVIIGIIALVILAVKNWGAIAHWLQGVWEKIKAFFALLWTGVKMDFQIVVNFFQAAASKIGSAFSGLGSFLHGIWEGIKTTFRNAINFVIGIMNDFIGFLDSIHITVPSINIGPIHTPGLNLGLSIPKIPTLATGGFINTGGWAIVGEQGPEMVKLPQASTVYPNGFGPPGGGGHGQQELHVHVEVGGQEVAHHVMTLADGKVRAKRGAYSRAA